MITKAIKPVRRVITCRGFSAKQPRLLSVEYKVIASRFSEFTWMIEEAYSANGLGILLVQDIPGYQEARRRLLLLGKKLGELPDSEKRKLEAPDVMYQVGWSHGIEKFKGKPDYLKGSFYANVLKEQYQSPLKKKVHNLWPNDSIPELKESFKTLGWLMFQVGKKLSVHIDKYVDELVPTYQYGKLSKTLNWESERIIGRLLHYFPVDKPLQEQDDLTYCGWHNDHSALTALTKAMYIDQQGNEVEVNDPDCGLFVQTRKGQIVRVEIPENAIAFQIGETAQIHSGGKLQATPHMVRTKPQTNGISRNTLAVFSAPPLNEPMSIPQGTDIQEVLLEKHNIPPLRERWNPSMNFKEFEANTFKAYNEF